MPRLIVAALCAALFPIQVQAQSSPGLVTGQVPTAAQWNAFFASKQDVLGYVPLNTAGGTMTGRLVTAASTASPGSGLQVPQGTAPTTPANGDVWMTSAGLFYRANGTTIGPLVDASGSGVDSVTAGNASLTISPTAGNVVASINLANANTWTAAQAATLSTNATFGFTATNSNGGSAAVAAHSVSNGTGTGYYGIAGTAHATAILTNRLAIVADAATDGIAINTSSASDPIVLGTNGTERARVLLGLMVGTTTDPGAGIINVLTGFRIGNAAASGQVLRGDGTNFVSSTLACGDLSNATAGCSNAIASAAEIAAAAANRTVDAAGLSAAGALVSLVDAATIDVNMATGVNFTVTLGGNRTLGAPSNTQAGRSGCIFLVQDGTGNRTLAYNAVWKFASGVDPVLSTAAGAVDMLCYIVRDSSNIMATITLNMS